MTEMEINLVIRNTSGNSLFGFVYENKQTELVQLMILFLGDEELLSSLFLWFTPRGIASIHGHKEINHILKNELTQQEMEKPRKFSIMLDDYSIT